MTLQQPNDSETVEYDELDEKIIGALATDVRVHWSYEQRKAVRVLIQDEILKARKETEKAFGGCHSCYGKGYATYSGEYAARGMRWPDQKIKFCDCERGKQLEAQLNQPNTSKETTNGDLVKGTK